MLNLKMDNLLLIDDKDDHFFWQNSLYTIYLKFNQSFLNTSQTLSRFHESGIFAYIICISEHILICWSFQWCLLELLYQNWYQKSSRILHLFNYFCFSNQKNLLLLKHCIFLEDFISWFHYLKCEQIFRRCVHYYYSKTYTIIFKFQ